MCLAAPERIIEITDIENLKIAQVDVGCITRGRWLRHVSEANVEGSRIDQASVAILLLSKTEARGAQSVVDGRAAPQQSAHSSDRQGAVRDRLQRAASRC